RPSVHGLAPLRKIRAARTAADWEEVMGTKLLRFAFLSGAAVLNYGALQAPAAADTALVVGKANSQAESIMTVNVGYDAGIFKRHGLDLKIEDFNGGGARVVQALTAGSIDIAIGAGTQMSFVAKGAPMMAVCESTTTLPY